jgi:hypothetical protein
VILARAVRRGEADPAKLTEQVTRLPVDLVRHDLIMTLAPVPEATLVEIVDEVFLPRCAPDGGSGERAERTKGVKRTMRGEGG